MPVKRTRSGCIEMHIKRSINSQTQIKQRKADSAISLWFAKCHSGLVCQFNLLRGDTRHRGSGVPRMPYPLAPYTGSFFPGECPICSFSYALGSKAFGTKEISCGAPICRCADLATKMIIHCFFMMREASIGEALDLRSIGSDQSEHFFGVRQTSNSFAGVISCLSRDSEVTN
jgi:hypothetical protein